MVSDDAVGIFETWGGKKGIVRTASYKRAEWLQSESTWGRYMHMNREGAEAARVAEKFRNAEPPAVLVSPSYGTGHDFPNYECEWIWIPKLPFPDRSDPVMIARMQDDPDY